MSLWFRLWTFFNVKMSKLYLSFVYIPQFLFCNISTVSQKYHICKERKHNVMEKNVFHIQNCGFLISYPKFYSIYNGDRIKTFFLRFFLPPSLLSFLPTPSHNTESISTCQYFNIDKYVTSTFTNSGQCPLPSVALFAELSQLIAHFSQ